MAAAAAHRRKTKIDGVGVMMETAVRGCQGADEWTVVRGRSLGALRTGESLLRPERIDRREARVAPAVYARVRKLAGPARVRLVSRAKNKYLRTKKSARRKITPTTVKTRSKNTFKRDY